MKDKPSIPVNMRAVEVRKKEILAPLKRDSGPGHQDLICQIHAAVVPLKYNFFRKKERLEEAIGKLKDAQGDLGKGVAKDFHQLVKLVEADAMAVSGEITFRAALEREETRGTHKREDFQNRDDKNWLKRIIVEQKDDKMNLYTEPVSTDKYKFKIR